VPKRLWLLPFLIASCSADASPTQHYSLGQDAAKFDSEIEAATLRHDTGFLKAVLAPDVRFTHSTGTAWDKQQWLAAVPRAPFTMRQIDAVEIEPHGGAIETAGQIHVKSDREIHLGSGAAKEYEIWYVRLYARRAGQWQLVSDRTVREEAR